MDFENKKLAIKGINDEVHYSRIVASFLRELPGFNSKNKFALRGVFFDWLKSMEVSDEDAQRVYNYMFCGKMELESRARKFIQDHYFEEG